MTGRGKRLNRRTVLGLMAATGGAGLLPRLAVGGEGETYLSACRNPNGAYAAALRDSNGGIVFSAPLPGRGHGCAIGPDGLTAVVFARRPGEFAAVLDIQGEKSSHLIQAAKQRHFYGHGCFSPDGGLLYATENAYDVSEGRIGIYETGAAYRRVGEFPTGGIGPHEALLLPDGETIVVANGGILTHPDYGRQKLNLAMMEPSLAYLDRRSGRIVEQVALPASRHQLSIRHLCLDITGDVWFGCQYEGRPDDLMPLVGSHRRGRPPAMIDLPVTATHALKNYVGSIAVNRSGTRLAATSSRGGAVIVWETVTHRLVNKIGLRSATGIAPAGPSSFTATSGSGRSIDTATGRRNRSDVRWDNHLTLVETRG